MTDNILEKLYEHNNWANRRTIEASATLSDEQLDTQPGSATKGSIRQTLVHLVTAQLGYLALLTLPVDARPRAPVPFAELQESARISGQGLLELARDAPAKLQTRLETTDGYYVEPWVVMVQVINHATEHREQVNSMLTALGITPPDLDGWTFGEGTRALIPIASPS